MRIRSTLASRFALGGFAVVVLGMTCQDPLCGCVYLPTWQATLAGANHVPPVTTSAAGTATFVLGPVGDSVAYTVTITSVPATTITHATLHRGSPATSTDTVAIELCGTGAASVACANLQAPGVLVANSVAITAAQLNTLRSYGYYANVSTVGNPNGEIRGQVRNAP